MAHSRGCWKLKVDGFVTTQNLLQAGASTGSARTEYQYVKTVSVRPEPVEGQLLRVHQGYVVSLPQAGKKPIIPLILSSHAAAK
jgi:hypothetical protein